MTCFLISRQGRHKLQKCNRCFHCKRTQPEGAADMFPRPLRIDRFRNLLHSSKDIQYRSKENLQMKARRKGVVWVLASNIETKKCRKFQISSRYLRCNRNRLEDVSGKCQRTLHIYRFHNLLHSSTDSQCQANCLGWHKGTSLDYMSKMQGTRRMLCRWHCHLQQNCPNSQRRFDTSSNAKTPC